MTERKDPPPASPDTGEREDPPSGSSASEPAHPPVVGIGASAGGLEALRTFFEALPAETGLAYAVVIHRTPERKSHLAELFQKITVLPVRDVSEPVAVEADHIYLAPPGMILALSDGHLVPAPFRETAHRSAPIDHFFRTMAEAQPDGMGVLFSGGGTDGTLGMRAIKEKGGLLLAQIPEEAEHKSMPRNVIATGLVDFVLPAKGIAHKLAELSRRPEPAVEPERPESLDEGGAAALAEILRLIRGRTGYDFSGYKRGTILRRLQRRMRIAGSRSLEEYRDHIANHSAEVAALQKDFLISVTRFFRDEEAYDALRREVVHRILDRERSGPVRLWTPGCATGEEAYSLAILFMEEAARRGTSPHLRIFATDLDGEALAMARRGLFPAAVESDLGPERIERFFIREGAFYRASQILRDCVVFAEHDLLGDPPFSRIDLLSCRNLLIYLEPDVQTRVFEHFRYSLDGGGYLFLGRSEHPPRGAGAFRVVDAEHHIYQCEGSGRPEASAAGKPDPSPAFRPLPSVEPGRTLRPPPHGNPEPSSHHWTALEEHAPPSVLVNPKYDLVHSSAEAGRYLRVPPGRPTSNLLEAVRAELGPALHASLYTAFEDGRPAMSPPIPMILEGEPRIVRTHVSPVREADPGPVSSALVLFLEEDPPDQAEDPAEGDASPDDLHDELVRTRDRLRRVLAALERERNERTVAEEQLLSVSEEYKLTLEELETSREELHSSNEELRSVNDELQLRLDDLSRANDDLKNLMAATDVAILFLDRDLRVMRFTPPATRLFYVLPEDEGRPLSHLTQRFGDVDIVRDARDVLARQTVVERDVEDDEGRAYLLRMMPYRTSEHRIEGVVVTFVEVTRLHEAMVARREIAERHQLLVDSLRDHAIVLLDAEGRVLDWGKSAERMMGFTEEEAKGKHISMIFTPSDRETDQPMLELDEARRTGQAADERWHVRRDGSRFWVSEILTALLEEDGTLRGFAKVMRDETDRRAAESARLHFQTLFESAPGLYLVVEPDTYRIVAASDAYLKATMTQRDEISGRILFEVFPDDPEEEEADGVENLRASFERVKEAKVADVMAVQRYPIPRPDAEGGGFEERFWSPINSPILGPDGDLIYIVHRVEDVTPFVRQMREEGREEEGHRLLERRAEHMEAEIVLRSREVERVNEELRRLNETLEARVARQTRMVRDLATRLTLAEQAERHRIAQVLHDDLQQMLFGAQLKLALLRGDVETYDGGPESLLERVHEADALIDDAIAKTRHLSVDLSPNILQGEGLAEALGWLASQMEEVHGLEVEVRADSPIAVRDEGMRVLLFQTVRELLFNVAKHAGVDHAVVLLEEDREGLSVSVVDEGVGFDRSRVPVRGENATFGLSQIEERMRMVRGTIEFDSAPGEGTTVRIHVPRWAIGERDGSDGLDDDPDGDDTDPNRSDGDPNVVPTDPDRAHADPNAAHTDPNETHTDPNGTRARPEEDG